MALLQELGPFIVGHRVLAVDGSTKDRLLFVALILLNLPWLSTVSPPPVWAAYVAVEVALYATLGLIAGRAPRPRGGWLGRGLILCIALAVAAQLAVLWVVRSRVHIVMDRDSALLTWLMTLGHGEFPYAHPTELDNPISAFPLVPMLAFPFVALGNIGYFEVGAYVLLAALLWVRYRARPFARALSILVLSTAPLVYLEVLTRSELIANSALLMVLLTFFEAREQSLGRLGILVLAGLGLGCLMATRLGFFPALAVVWLFLLRRLPLSSFLPLLGLAVATFAAIVGPFFLWNPALFTSYAPLGVNVSKLHVSPLAETLWPAATGLVALACGLLARRAADLYLGVAAVMLSVTLGTYLSGFVDVSYFQLSFIPLLFSFGRDCASREQLGPVREVA